jgi:hypothetical protein
MKVSPNRKDIGDYFISYGWLSLIFIIVSYVAWYWSITTIDEVKPSEKINFFIESYGLKDNTLSADIVSRFSSKGVVESNLYNYSPKDASIGNYYTKFGTESDFIILYQSDLDTMFQNVASTSVLSSFLPFTSAFKDTAIPTGDYDYYSVNGQDYALKLYDAADASYNALHPFTGLIDFTLEGTSAESSYLLLNASTPNFAPYGNGTTGNAVLALPYFLSLYHA